MKKKIFLIPFIILISTFLFLCFRYDTYEVYWTDFRTNKIDETATLHFRNMNNFNNRKDVIFRFNKTNKIILPKNNEDCGIQTPTYIVAKYIIDFENKKMEFFLFDYEDIKIEKHCATLEKKPDVYAYGLGFIDENEKWLFVHSKDNVIDISDENIRNLSAIEFHTGFKDKDIAYYSEEKNIVARFGYIASYLIKSKILNEYVFVTNDNSGFEYNILNKEILPDWLID